jgi:thymidylate synthase (FAD)
MRNPDAEALIGKQFDIPPHGFVRLVDYLGGDAATVQAARVSYGEGTKTVREDGALIDYLMRMDHSSPFEMTVLKFHLKMPIFVCRQLIRTRTASVNEVSGRYSEIKDEFYVPPLQDIAAQSKNNKQGRMDVPFPEPIAHEFSSSVETVNHTTYNWYKRALDNGVARELARVVLPLTMYTELYWQINLHNLFRFLKQRLDLHAQKEIRDLAQPMAEIAKAVAPMAWEAFEEHQLYADKFSRTELQYLKDLVRGQISEDLDARAYFDGSERKFNEFKAKLGLS